MRIRFLSLAAAAAIPMTATRAQQAQRLTGWDFTAGVNDRLVTASGGLLTAWDLLPGKRIRAGLGARATFVSGEQQLTPAGAHDVPAGVIDTLTVSTDALMVNAVGQVGIVLTSRLDIGLNIDLAGFGAGPSKNGSYRASSGSPATSVDASPSAANLFLYGSKDRGSLNSEFFAAWRVNERLVLRGGLSHQLTEYRTERTMSSNTDRFRHYANLLFAGARIRR